MKWGEGSEGNVEEKGADEDWNTGQRGKNKRRWNERFGTENGIYMGGWTEDVREVKERKIRKRGLMLGSGKK